MHCRITKIKITFILGKKTKKTLCFYYAWCVVNYYGWAPNSVTLLLLLFIYDGIKSLCLGAECHSHVVLRIQPISALGFDVKQTGKSSLAEVSSCERHEHSESLLCQCRILLRTHVWGGSRGRGYVCMYVRGGCDSRKRSNGSGTERRERPEERHKGEGGFWRFSK